MAKVEPSVKLLKHTQNPEETIALAAKLCYSDAPVSEIEKGVAEKDISGFIRKLIDMGHLSPVEHASFTFALEGISRSVLAQITRHRIASFSVKSQRYVRYKDGFDYIIPPAIEALGAEAVSEFEDQMTVINGFYEGWLKRLKAGEEGNEDARFVLPNACETKIIMTMNARELMHFFNLRCCNRAQWEIRHIAWEMLKLAVETAPCLFEKAGPLCLKGACPEGKMCCGKAKEMKEKREKLC